MSGSPSLDEEGEDEAGNGGDLFADDLWAEGAGSVRDESKFTKLFSDFLVSVPVSDSGFYMDKNDLYCPSAFKAIEFHVHLFPLFSKLVTQNNSSVPLTNMSLDNWFKFVKNTLCQKRLQRRPYEFIKIINQHVGNSFKESRSIHS